MLTDTLSCFEGKVFKYIIISWNSHHKITMSYFASMYSILNIVSGYLACYLSLCTEFLRHIFAHVKLRDGQKSKANGHCAREDDPQGICLDVLGLLGNATPKTSPTEM